MKIYISADLEGITGVSAWDEVDKSHKDYPRFQAQMTEEVKAACAGALAAGAKEIVVKDAHATGRNIIAGQLPEAARLVSGWSRHPYGMMQELDNSFDAALMIGYHTGAGGDQNPLAHTLNSAKFAWITMNGRPTSEFLMNSYTASLEKVPVVFIAGDQGVCREALDLIPQVHTVAVKAGRGDSTLSIHPRRACRRIEKDVAQALRDLSTTACLELPGHFEVVVQFNNFKDAYRGSFYPGARLLAPGRISFTATDYLDVLKLFLFI